MFLKYILLARFRRCIEESHETVLKYFSELKSIGIVPYT